MCNPNSQQDLPLPQKVPSCPFPVSSAPTFRSNNSSHFFNHKLILPVQELNVNGIISVYSCVWGFFHSALCSWVSSLLSYKFVPFYCWVEFHFMNTLQFSLRHQGCFQFMAIMHKASKNIYVQVFLCFFFSWVITQERNCWLTELLTFSFMETFVKVVVPFYIPTNKVRQFWLLHIFANIRCCQSFLF